MSSGRLRHAASAGRQRESAQCSPASNVVLHPAVTGPPRWPLPASLSTSVSGDAGGPGARRHSTFTARSREGSPSRAGLPPADTRRWIPSRKALVVEAIHREELDFVAACDRWGLTPTELGQWIVRYELFGPLGLRATKGRRLEQASAARDASRPASERP